MKKAIPISYLNPGHKFEFIDLKNYKDCSVKRNSEAGTWIEGSHRHGKDDPWKTLPVGYVVSNQAMVYFLN